MITIINDNNQTEAVIRSLAFLCNASLRNKSYHFKSSDVQRVLKKCLNDVVAYDVMNSIYELDGIRRLYPLSDLIKRYNCSIDDIEQIEFISLYRFKKIMKSELGL